MRETQARKLVRERARGRCEVCGGNGYQWSHRRTRSIRDEHTWCPCNGLLACSTCHMKMHMNPEWARERGLHVSSFVDEPGTVPVMLRSFQWRLHCDGSFSPVPATDSV
jgi:hypothetical protein